MNIEETRNFLTMLWSLFPNAPKVSPEEKKATVVAWFYVLHEYAIGDVWAASQAILHEKPIFIPTAFEILSRCRKTTNPNRFLGDEYAELENRFIGSTHIYQPNDDFDYEIFRLTRDQMEEKNEDSKEKLQHLIRQNVEQRNIHRRMDYLLTAALNAAESEYDRIEYSKYSKDLMQLGFSPVVQNTRGIQ